MYALPSIFQIRDNCIVAYTDFSTLPKNHVSKTIKLSGTYSKSAQKRFKKYLQLWNYTMQGIDATFSFITLTLSSKEKSEINYTTMLKRMIEKLNTRYKNFNYAWKIEYQKNGNTHFHIITDIEIDWKVVRGCWNKIQKIHVDEYQLKMKNKYKNGYYFDDKMVNNKNEIIEDKIQYSRYLKGKKANWRNPNSTDVKVETTTRGIGNYIGKYIAKNEEETATKIEKNKTNRYYGMCDRIRSLKYATINETDLNEQELYILIDAKQREIKNELLQTTCIISEKVYTETVKIREAEQLKKNRDILYKNEIIINKKLIEKETAKYIKLYIK